MHILWIWVWSLCLAFGVFFVFFSSSPLLVFAGCFFIIYLLLFTIFNTIQQKETD